METEEGTIREGKGETEKDEWMVLETKEEESWNKRYTALSDAEARRSESHSFIHSAKIYWTNGTPLQYSCLENLMDGGVWKAAVHGVAEGRTWLSDFTFTFHFHALEKEMATHSSVLAWRIPGMGKPGGLPSMGSHRVGHDWSDLAIAMLWLAPFQVLRESCKVNITGKTPHPSGNFIQVEERKLKEINKYMVHIHIKLSVCIGLNSDHQEYTSKSWPLALWMWFYLEMGYLQM